MMPSIIIPVYSEAESTPGPCCPAATYRPGMDCDYELNLPMSIGGLERGVVLEPPLPVEPAVSLPSPIRVVV